MRRKYGVNKYMENLNRNGNYIREPRISRFSLDMLPCSQEKGFHTINSKWSIGLHIKQYYKDFHNKTQAETQMTLGLAMFLDTTLSMTGMFYILIIVIELNVCNHLWNLMKWFI